MVVHSRKNGRKHVRFETGGVQQVVLEQLAGVVRFVEHLQWQIPMRSVGQLSQPILQLSGQIDNISAAANRSFVGCGVWVRVARRRRLFCPSSINAYHSRNGDCQDRAEPGNPGLLHLISLQCSIFFVNHCGGHDCECGPQPPRLREQW